MMKKQIHGILFLMLVLLACSDHKKPNTKLMTANLDKEGHRGCRGLMPENTIPAMLAAIDLGVTTLEMDVVISKDRKVVVSHDPWFSDQLTTTPEGLPLTKNEAEHRLLFDMDYDSISKYDVGLRPHPGFPRQKKIAVHKPLLSDLIDSAEAYAQSKHHPVRYNIEIKSTPQGDGKEHPLIPEFVDLVMKLIQEKNIQSRTVIQSFDIRALQQMHRQYPDVVTALLIEEGDQRDLSLQLQELGFTPSIYSPHYSLVTPERLQQCHALKMKVIPWTINTLPVMKQLVEMGVDGIISDYPDLFAQL
jgi:glycerophosphoryl diester phosphodiesterase